MASIVKYFPVISSSCKNGIEEPLPFFDETDWRNQNRKKRSQEELDKLFSEYCDSDFEIAFNEVVLAELNRNEYADFISPEKYKEDTIYAGKIIKMGKECFDKVNFRCGATASYGDFVVYDLLRSQEKNTSTHRLIIVKDRDIIGFFKDPTDFLHT